MITPKVMNGEMSEEEQQKYVDIMVKEYPDVTDATLEITIDGEYVDLDLIRNPVKFQRIRRITGYLVGTLDKFNDAKRAEVEQRVKHGSL